MARRRHNISCSSLKLQIACLWWSRDLSWLLACLLAGLLPDFTKISKAISSFLMKCCSWREKRRFKSCRRNKKCGLTYLFFIYYYFLVESPVLSPSFCSWGWKESRNAYKKLRDWVFLCALLCILCFWNGILFVNAKYR